MTRPNNRVLRFLLDTLLVPIAVVIVLIEDVLWAGALALLRRVNDLPAVRALRVQLERLPAAIALPLFLVPESVSHIAGAYATVLLAQGRVKAAILVGGLVKGLCTLLLVWIYQCCEETLLRVAWFARLHHWALAARDWAKAKFAPLRARARAMLAPLGAALRAGLARLRGEAASPPLNPGWRLRAWRDRFAIWLRAVCGR